MKLSITSVMIPRWDLDQTFDKLTEYGYDAVELRVRDNVYLPARHASCRRPLHEQDTRHYRRPAWLLDALRRRLVGDTGRGPGATLWGANAMNGIVNITTTAASQPTTSGGWGRPGCATTST